MSYLFRVVFASRENYRLINDQMQIYAGTISGKLRNSSFLPTVGDWVKGTMQPGNWVQITEVLPRKSVLSRADQILAANVDTLLIVTSANQDLNVKRLDRYLTLAKNMKPIIVVNKIELWNDWESEIKNLAQRYPQVEVLGVSVYQGTNLSMLESLAQKGQTLVFVGSSGVGKSSLSNYLLGSMQISTQHIRESDGRGRHTTTHRELHYTTSGAAIIDSPGIREVGLSEEADLSIAFSEVEEIAKQCRFRDCSHNSEPGCAIHAALQAGELDQDLWQSYLKLKRELDFQQRRANKALQSQERKKWAKIQREYRTKKLSRWE